MGKLSPEMEAILSRAVSFKEKNPNISIAQVARQFDVSKHVLRSRLIGIGPPNGMSTTIRLFSESEEAAIVKYIHQHDNFHDPVSREGIVAFANTILKARSSPDDRNLPVVAPRWIDGFLTRKRCKALPQKVIDARIKKVEEEDIINYWFLCLQDTISQYKISEEDIWNASETQFHLRERNSEPEVEKHPRSGTGTVSGSRETATVIESVSAIGKTCPLFVVLKSSPYLKESYNTPDMDPSTEISTSTDGHNTDQIQLDWIDFFHDYTDQHRVGKYRLLLLDGFGYYYTREFLEKCEEYHIHPFLFPSYSRRPLQPLDVGIFQPLKDEYSRLARVSDCDDYTYKLKKAFLSNLEKARDTVLQPNIIKSAFKKAGIAPLDRNIVLPKLADEYMPVERPSTPYSQESDEGLNSPVRTPRTTRQFMLLCREIKYDMKEMKAPPCFLEKLSRLEKGIVQKTLYGKEPENNQDEEEST